MSSSAIAGIIISLISGLAVLARLLFKHQLEKEVRRQVAIEKERDALKSYQQTREKLDAVQDPRDASIDDLREWLRKRGNEH